MNIKDKKCPFCGHQKSRFSYLPTTFFNNKNFHYLECTRCNLIYLFPFLNSDDYNELYKVEYHEEFYFKSENEYPIQYKILEKYKKGNSLLDYGCGDASLLKIGVKKGFSCYGIEYNLELVNRLKEEFPGINFQTLEDFWEGKGDNLKFDIIHLGDVLEHLTNPKDLVLRLSSKLAENGLLFVEGPLENNFHLGLLFRKINFLIKKIVKPNYVANHKPFHTIFTNYNNQQEFFNSLGFKTEYYKVYETPWPYPSSWKSAAGVSGKIKFLLGKFSILFSTLCNKWGNRFYYVGRLTK